MRIAIDGNEANVDIRVGIGQYAFELLTNFYKFEVPNIEFEIYLKDQPRSDLPKQREGWKYVQVGPSKLWTQIGLPVKLFTTSRKPDVFFSPSHYAPRFAPVPTVISIMDMSFIHFPELFKKSDLYQLTEWTKYSALNAKKILTISNASKNDIIKIYRIPEEKVVVTYLGLREKIGKSMQSLTEITSKYNISEEYILFVGTLQPRKNIERLIEAFSLLKDEFPKLNLVIVGKKGWLYENILAAPRKYNVQDTVKFLDFVSDENLPSLYQHAQVYVLPSLYEGFGLPVLEAMQYDCPVITSNISSLPEAGGDAAEYIDPTNVQNIADTIKEVLNNPKKRENMIKKGHEQIKKFSWEKTAKETLEVLESVANAK